VIAYKARPEVNFSKSEINEEVVIKKELISWYIEWYYENT
jgi:hypothetical protein